jgi:hypothetical protein
MNLKKPALGLDPRVQAEFPDLAPAETAELSRWLYKLVPAQSGVRVRKIVKNLLVLLHIVQSGASRNDMHMKAALRRVSTLVAFRWLDLWLIAILAVGSFGAILRIGMLPANASGGVAVIYAPWTTADQTMIRAVSAGARFVRFGGFDFIAIVVPEEPDYVERVLAGSALLAVDPQVLAGCLPASFRKKADAL